MIFHSIFSSETLPIPHKKKRAKIRHFSLLFKSFCVFYYFCLRRTFFGYGVAQSRETDYLCGGAGL